MTRWAGFKSLAWRAFPDVLLHTFRILQFDPAVAFGPVVDGVDLTGQVASKFQQARSRLMCH